MARLGVNLPKVSYWTPEYVTPDLVKVSKAPTFDPPTPAPELDARGWPVGLAPGQSCNILLGYRTIGGAYPGGKYRVSWLGEGSVRVRWDAKDTTFTSPTGNLVEVTPTTTGVLLSILTSHPANPVRDVVMMPEDIPGIGPYVSKQFLNTLAPFSCVRFMNWMETGSGNTKVRIEANTRSWVTPEGVPIEVIAHVCRVLHIKPWLSVPYAITDDEVARLAQQFVGLSEPVYVEYSNEVWNSIFPQFKYASAKAAEAGLSLEAWYVKRSREIFEIFKGAGVNTVRVIATQLGNTYRAGKILGALNPGEADVLAVGGYFGADYGKDGNWQRTSTMTVDQLFETGELFSAVQDTVDKLQVFKGLADSEGLTLCVYEGGQHLWGVSLEAKSNDALTALFVAANRDPRMKDCYYYLLNAWKKLGGDLFMLFCTTTPYGANGCWGLQENSFTSTPGPKMSAALLFAEEWEEAPVVDEPVPPPPTEPTPPAEPAPPPAEQPPSIQADMLFLMLGAVSQAQWLLSEAIADGVLTAGERTAIIGLLTAALERLKNAG